MVSYSIIYIKQTTFTVLFIESEKRWDFHNEYWFLIIIIYFGILEKLIDNPTLHTFLKSVSCSWNVSSLVILQSWLPLHDEIFPLQTLCFVRFHKCTKMSHIKSKFTGVLQKLVFKLLLNVFKTLEAKKIVKSEIQWLHRSELLILSYMTETL